MQINFTPQKIKDAKSYIENLEGFLDEKGKKERGKKKKISFFKRIQNFFMLSTSDKVKFENKNKNKSL